MTKQNRRTKAGLQNPKAITDAEIANEITANNNNNKSAKKSRPHS
jgi:hypothetical protein